MNINNPLYKIASQSHKIESQPGIQLLIINKYRILKLNYSSPRMFKVLSSFYFLFKFWLHPCIVYSHAAQLFYVS